MSEVSEINEYLGRYDARFVVQKSRAKLGSLWVKYERTRSLQWRLSFGKIKRKMIDTWGCEYMSQLEPIQYLFKKVEGKTRYED